MSIPTSSSHLAERGFLRPAAGDIHYFAAISDYPCVSILLPTRPQTRMAADDQARLDGLVRVARARLQSEGVADGDELVDGIAQLASRLTELPTDLGLVIYASRGMLEYRHLPVPVAERVIIDPTFATRDLVASIQANPAYLLVVLDAEVARLYASRTGSLAEVTTGGFPLGRDTVGERQDPGTRPGRRRGARPGRQDSREREQTRGFLRKVDRLVAEHVTAEPRPVVVMAGDRILSDYLSVTSLSGRIIGLARNSGSRASLRRLERTVRPLLADHLQDLEAAAHDTLEARLPGREVVGGLPACWHAAVSERPELLLVEDGYAMPARLSSDGSLLAPTVADEREMPEVLDDAVDELVELVIARGGQVRFVPDGSLHQHERVALSVLMPQPRRRRRR